jgi:hypothetical protein
MNTTTETILEQINVVKLTQPALAQVLAMVILRGESVDWKTVNAAIRNRWSGSARGRVLTLASRIVEDAGRRAEAK